MYIYKRQEGGRITKCFDYTLETTIAITPDGDGVRRRRKCPRQTKKRENQTIRHADAIYARLLACREAPSSLQVGNGVIHRLLQQIARHAIQKNKSKWYFLLLMNDYIRITLTKSLNFYVQMWFLMFGYTRVINNFYTKETTAGVLVNYHKKKFRKQNLLFNHVVVKELGHDGKSDARPSSVHNARDFFVLKANNVLPIDFQQIVIREEAVTSRR